MKSYHMTEFKLSFHRKTLTLIHPFTIARGTKAAVDNVIVELQADNITGFGEAGPNIRYGEDAGKVMDFLKLAAPDGILKLKSPVELELMITNLPNYTSSGHAALEMAWWDWHGKTEGQPLWKLWGMQDNKGPVTSFTIGLDEIAVMQDKAEKASEYPILKVKLGTELDKEIISALREVTDKPIRIDANEGWKTLDDAIAMIEWLADKNIELVEQPMPSDMIREMNELKYRSPLPLVADESFTGDEPLDQIKECFHVINIKLMKIGSLLKGRQKIRESRKLGLKCMIGCMVESSLANSAGGLLALDTEFADLDGHLLIRDDPYEGLELNDRKEIILSEGPGLGVILRN